MKSKIHDHARIKLALSIKEIVESIIAMGGGIALLALGFIFWGNMCMLAGILGVLSTLLENQHPKIGRIGSVAKLLVEAGTLIAGAVTLLSYNSIAGGVVCLYICVQQAVTRLIVMPIVERKYLTDADKK